MTAISRLKLAVLTAYRIVQKERRPKVLIAGADSAILVLDRNGWRFSPGDIEADHTKLAAGFATVLRGFDKNHDRANRILGEVAELMNDEKVSIRPGAGGVVTSYSIH